MEVFTLNASQIDEWWPTIKPFIERCEKEQFEWTTENVRKALSDRDAQFWGVAKDKNMVGCFVTQLETGLVGGIGRVWIVSGDLKDSGLEAYRSVIEPWFNEKGCDVIAFEGRKGWQKILPDYQVQSIRMVKKLCSTSVH